MNRHLRLAPMFVGLASLLEFPAWLARLLLLVAALSAFAPADPAAAQSPIRYVRYLEDGMAYHGIVEGNQIHQIEGDIFRAPRRTGVTIALSSAVLLAPVEPGKVIAVGLNYASHLGDRTPAEYPGLFAKLPTSIIGPGADIVIPADAGNVHYEGELVLVIGRTAHNVSATDAHEYIFGVTAGNDVSERDWQAADLQWFRAKASDTFGPLGPMIVSGLNYGDLHVETRLNGDVRQSASSADLIFDVDEIVSYVSRYVTLEPGDVIYTGTPGSTRAMQPGDVVEVEIEGVGILRNPVVKAGG